MSLEDTLFQSQRWMDVCIDQVNTLIVPPEDKARVAAALHQLSIAHFTGIHVLVENGVYSSAFALYRSQLEAYVRGAWYHPCATESQVSCLIAGGAPPSPKTQMLELEQSGVFDPGSLIKIKDVIWDDLCDFAHGGSVQMKARAATTGKTGRDLHADDVAALLITSGTTALLAGLGLAAVTENEGVAIGLRDSYHAIFPQSGTCLN